MRALRMSAMKNALHSFKGFDDYVEIFKAGTQVDSTGRSREWTRGDLDQIVANHSAAPIVIGHPNESAPAYGWTSELRRDGDVLLAKFSDVHPEFSKLVEQRRYPNRSVRIRTTPEGLKLDHVGFLGAAPPAVEGLRSMQFAAGGEFSDFSYSDAYALRLISQMFRGIRDALIGELGQSRAESALKADSISELERLAAEEAAEPSEPDDGASEAQFSRDSKNALAAAVADADARARAADEARQRAEQQLADFQRAQRLTAARAEVGELIGAGRLSPAQADGVADFIASESAQSTFSFSAAADGAAVNSSGAEIVRRLLSLLPKQLPTPQSSAASAIDRSSTDSLVEAARDFQRQQHEAGVSIQIHEAIAHVARAHS